MRVERKKEKEKVGKRLISSKDAIALLGELYISSYRAVKSVFNTPQKIIISRRKKYGEMIGKQ